ncbi:MAG TPA: M20/M25/M40 family metallo-hydrolase [Luteimonas sp.]|nr:M20/M25/M40 family metallo-hydrolase [Luteimonas sp.]
MRRAALLPVLFALSLAACQREAPPPAEDASAAEATPPDWADDPAALRIEADVRALADDAMEGRETGTRGYEKASDYVARRFAEIELQPAGDDGSFFQRVPLLKATREREGAYFAVNRNGRHIELRLRDQFLPQPDFNAARAAVEAPAVFVGQAVHAPALGVDDFKGLDLKGKIAVLFGGAPARFDDDRRAFHASYREKLRQVAAHGAIGAVFVNTVQDEAGSPWAQHAANWDKPAMRLRGDDGRGIDTFPQLRVVASVSAAAADLVFADAPLTAAQRFDAARDGTLRGFALPGTIALAARTTIEPAQSRNVVARLPGDDDALATEHIVYSAHLDHVGIGAPVEGDRIYNGALDNALGVAIMLETAHQLADAKDRPKRSLLFVATTAEEKGLLGAEWFATHPTVAAGSMVANINMDMPVLMAPTTDVVPIGVEHSSLQATLEAAAKDTGVALSPDPFPEENVFVRSDQYAFIRAGVPAVYLAGGVESADKDKARDPKVALRYFLRNCYHRPCDDADTQPIQYGDAARMARLNARIGQRVGDEAERPRWNEGDFFGDMFAR